MRIELINFVGWVGLAYAIILILVIIFYAKDDENGK